MKNIVILGFCLMSFLAKAQFTIIPDQNFEQALIAFGHDNVLDGQVLTSNINGITSLNVSLRGINSLQGIEDFTSLSTLICNDNNLTSLNLSNLLNLNNLNAVNNNLTGLLDLSNNSMLDFIWIANNNLTRLNIQNGNNLSIGSSDFNSNNNPNLVCVQVDDVTYSNNTWTFVDDPNVFRLDCSEIFVPDDNFEQELINLGYDDVLDDYVYVFNINNVLNLDISNKNITDLTGIQGFENLEILACQNNQITTIDLSLNTNLEQISCHNNAIDALDLSMTNNLVLLNVSNNQLTTLNLKNGNNTNVSLFNALNNPMLRCIEVDDVNYSNTNWSSAIDNTASFNSDCSQIFVPDDNFESALISLGYDDVLDDFIFKGSVNSITSLNVSLNGIADLTGIQAFEALENLNCARNNLTSLNVSQNTNLQVLNCNRNQITSLSITDGSGTLQNNLTELYCGNNQLNFLLTNFYPNVQILNCSNNNITNLNSIWTNANLQQLICNNNNITSLNVNSNTMLIELDARNNILTSLSVKNGNNTNFTNFNTLSNPNLFCIAVDDVSWSNTNWNSTVDNHTSFSLDCNNIFLDANIYLQGAAINPNTGEEMLMRDDLRVSNNISVTSPYTDAISCSSSVFNTTGNNAIVDWVWIELRDQTDNTNIISSRSGLLQRDGDIVDVDGTSSLSFQLTQNSYYVAIKHRNHLGVMSLNPTTISHGGTSLSFSNGTTATYGTNALTANGMPTGIFGLWSGDANNDSVVRFSGTDNDANTIKSEILAAPGNILDLVTYDFSGYHNADNNMNGAAKFSGANNDANHIKSIVLNHPSNILGLATFSITEQLP